MLRTVYYIRGMSVKAALLYFAFNLVICGHTPVLICRCRAARDAPRFYGPDPTDEFHRPRFFRLFLHCHSLLFLFVLCTIDFKSVRQVSTADRRIVFERTDYFRIGSSRVNKLDFQEPKYNKIKQLDCFYEDLCKLKILRWFMWTICAV